ncbi:MAG: protein-L-isoaspartate(D-aspartate) O-methyltransferase [Bacteroidetes bacterium]|nr:protein-L-isoaspartate(D-aspartate) O-methyltransferase [Bacteroidota bacterium]MBU1115300.1 protein-L-isoaspartate(D-aspartate) O-methyltransferase [Bacteroidota bacterium]MBU1799587.1 protein-L-isoaspartate(D-aspartate) O-methyltransferase [Bacteroidota bacterium]
MYETERQELIKVLIGKGITDENVLKAFFRVERHLFVPEIIKPHAYSDVALPIGHEQTISQPYTVAFMTQALELDERCKILEIGTGSGFQAAILVDMGMKVYSIERNYEIHQRTQKLFDDLGIRAALIYGDGTIGWEEAAPYDRIIVTAGGPEVPKRLLKQLAVGGKMVIPVGDRNSQTMQIITKISETELLKKEIPNFKFVPLIGKEGWKNE